MNPIEIINNTELISKEDLISSIKLLPNESRILELYKKATPLDWEDWQWQMRNRIRTKEMLAKVIKLSAEEENAMEKCGEKLAIGITPYFASLIDPENVKCPVRLQCVPRCYELEDNKEEMIDPCGEDKCSPAAHLVHRYPDRVLFLSTETCATYCRYCTRSRIVGNSTHKFNIQRFKEAFEYIKSHKEIRDVLISGGDPLTYSNYVLESIIKQIKAIPHVEFIRIGTRAPVTLPQRITLDLVNMLKKYKPVWMSIHFSSPMEITDRVKKACELLVDNGIPLGSQTVLLKGINDNAETMKKLVHELLKIRVRPYYLYQCDPIKGSRHFRTSISKGAEIIKSLRGFTTGYAVPTYVVDAPGGGGKVPLEPQNIVSVSDKGTVVKNFAGKEYLYPDTN